MTPKKPSIDETIDKFVKDNLIGEDDRVYAKTIITWMIKGEREAKKVSALACKNLRDCGFVSKDGKLYFNLDSDDNGIEFCMLICGAQGFIKYVRTPKPKAGRIHAEQPTKASGGKTK